jgi:hypothetical protein
MIKFTAGKYEVEYKSGRVWEVYLSATQRRAFNQDLMEDLEIKSLRLKGQGIGYYRNMARYAIIALLWLVLSPILCQAQDYTNEQIADSIYKAEGGSKTSHPYGILKHYKTTTPRQACLNTISHSRRHYNEVCRDIDFIQWLSLTYCPIGAKNDPQNLNKNWVGNVRYFLLKEEAKARLKADK